MALYKKYSYLCITDTPYTLLLYLLYCKEEDIKTTFFLLGDNISDEICSKLPHCYHYSTLRINQWLAKLQQYGRLYRLFRLYYLKWLYYRWIKICKTPWYTKYRDIFCIDHIEISSVIIGNRNYTLIEDSPLRCMYYPGKQMQADICHRNIMSWVEYKLAGPIHTWQYGSHFFCRQLLFTTPSVPNYLKTKKIIILDVKEKWENATENQKKQILNVFNCTNEDVLLLQSRNIVLFTQPLYKDIPNFSISDQVHLYKKVLSKYPPSQVIIKIHPRDEINYSVFFPKHKLFQKQIPSQLMEVLDIRHEKAITIFSTAVCMSYPLQIDWYGTEVDERIFKVYGQIAAPEGARLCKLEE